MKINHYKLVFIALCILFMLNVFSENVVKMDISKYEGTLKQIGDEWYLNTGEDFFKLILAPESFLLEQEIVLENRATFICDGVMEIKEIFVYSIYKDNNMVKLRSESGEQLWKETESLNKTYYTVEARKCIACQLCVKYCPVNAIEMIKGVAVIDAEKCIACGICVDGNNNNFKGCPVKAISKVN